MYYEEYLKQTGANHILWMKSEGHVNVRFPFKSGDEMYMMNLSKTRKPYLVAGNYAMFKDVLEITLLRNYRPNLLRITEISSEEGYRNSSPLFERTLNMRRMVAPNGDAKHLNAYLVAVYKELCNLVDTQSTGSDIHSVIVFSNIISKCVLNSDPADANVSVMLLQKIRNLAADKGNVTLLFMEEEIKWHNKIEEILGSYEGMCFQCDRETSTAMFGTDIAATLKSNDICYVSTDDGELTRVCIPVFEDNEIDNILTRIICSR